MFNRFALLSRFHSVLAVIFISILFSCGSDPVVPDDDAPQETGSWYIECTSSDLRDVWRSEEGVAFAVGTDGMIFKFEDNSWIAMSNSSQNSFLGIWGTAPNDVFAVGHDGIFHYDGIVWSRMDLEENYSLSSIWGRSAADVFAVGANGILLHYDGIEWTVIRSEEHCNLNDVWTTTGSDVYAIGYFIDFFIADKPIALLGRYDGENWHVEMTDTTMEFSGIWGSSDDDIYIVGTYDFSDNPYVRDIWGMVQHYDGSEWELAGDVTLLGYPFRGIHGTGPDNLCIAGDEGTIIRYDGGMWRVLTSGTSSRLNSVWCGLDSEYISVGDAGTIVSSSDGIQWENVEGFICGLTDLWGSSMTDLYGVRHGEILHFDGFEWNAMSTDVGSGSLQAIWGNSSNDIFASNSYGSIYHYNGVGWGRMDYSGERGINDFWGSSGSDVYGVTATGIMHFDGTVWEEVLTGEYDLDAIWGSSEDFIFAVGGGPLSPGNAILFFDGNSWEEMVSPVDYQLCDIWGISESDIYAVGGNLEDFGTIIHYDGTEWAEVYSGPSSSLLGVWGSSGTDVYAVGTYGKMLHFDGTEWTDISVYNDHLYCIWGDSGNDIIVGGFNSIMKYSEQ